MSETASRPSFFKPSSLPLLSRQILRTHAWFVVAFTILIVIWGAWVRISGSGAGCGDHWPLCNGELVPSSAHSKTWVEYSHRISTGVYGFLILGQLVVCRALFPPNHVARMWAGLTLLFTITEALIGAKLVLFGLVDQSVALARLVVMPLHLLNTSLLLFSTVMCASSLTSGALERQLLDTKTRRLFFAVVILLAIMLFTGAIASLGSHLDPSRSIIEGITKDLDPNAHPAVRFRILHPLLGVVLPLLLVLVMVQLRKTIPYSRAQISYARVAWCAMGTVAIGGLTLLLLAPTFLKLTHLIAVNALIVATSLAYFHTRYHLDE